MTDFLRRYRVEIGWWLYVAVNAFGILLFREWATVPFHFIWIGLSLLYGWRVWGSRATWAVLAAVILVTTVTMIEDVVSGEQAVDELTEIPLMSAVFLAMVWYVRRSVISQAETRRVSERNLALLQQEQRFVQDASHVLRSPLTIALGNAEVLERTTVDPGAARDARAVIAELKRLKEITDRLLALATSEQPDFVHPVDTPVREVVARCVAVWSSTYPSISVGRVENVVAPLDPNRILEALDELINNAVKHAPAHSPVELSARRRDGHVVLAVADRGPGIPVADRAAIFDRFTRNGGDSTSGVGLGLAIVKAIAEAHGGSVGVRSRPGCGAVFELRLPAGAVEPTPELAAPATAGDRVG